MRGSWNKKGPLSRASVGNLAPQLFTAFCRKFKLPGPLLRKGRAWLIS